MRSQPPCVLVIVQNLPVPMDRRVWLECQELRRVGYEVAVICPKAPGDPRYAELDGVHLYKYRPAPGTTGLVSYLLEFVYSWLRTAVLSVHVRRRHAFTVIQACNPPDTYWALAALWRPLGVRFVYDQHDLNPELFLSRFGTPQSVGGRAQLAVLSWLERMTYRMADQVISTNESYRTVAVRRGRLDPNDVTVVRSGPDTSIMRPIEADPALRRGGRHLLAYVGIMGPQDNVDVLLRVMSDLVHVQGRTDVRLVLMGFGDCLEPLQKLSRDLDLQEFVTFTGRVDQATMARYLSVSTLGLCPDLKTPLNDVSTHNKTMEYMAFGLPVVSFDLVENRVSAQDCAVYVASGDERAFSEAIGHLLDNPSRRTLMGARARERCVSVLDWRMQAELYVSVFDRITGRGAQVGGRLPVAEPGPLVIDLRDQPAAANLPADPDRLRQEPSGRR